MGSFVACLDSDRMGREVVGRIYGWTLERCICWGKEKKTAGLNVKPTGNEGESSMCC